MSEEQVWVKIAANAENVIDIANERGTNIIYNIDCRTVIYIQAELTRLRSIVSRVEDVEGIENVIKDFWGAPSWKIAELVRDYAMGEVPCAS